MFKTLKFFLKIFSLIIILSIAINSAKGEEDDVSILLNKIEKLHDMEGVPLYHF